MNRRNARTLGFLTFVYLVLVAVGMLVTSLSMKDGPPSMGRRLARGTMPMMFMAVAVVFMVRAYAHVDELERKIQIEALAIAFASTAFFTLLCGQLQVIQVGVPPINWSFVWPLMAFIWTLSYLAVKIRYR